MNLTPLPLLTIAADCTCDTGGFSLEEFQVALAPIVLMRQSYVTMRIESSTQREEMDHVRDLSAWANGARAGAEQLEGGFKSQRFSSEQACAEAASAAMQSYLSSDILPAWNASSEYWDKSGRHRLVVP